MNQTWTQKMRFSIIGKNQLGFIDVCNNVQVSFIQGYSVTLYSGLFLDYTERKWFKTCNLMIISW